MKKRLVVDRRTFVEQATCAAVGAFAFCLVGCKTNTASAEKPDLVCTDTTGLKPAEIKVRENLKYVDKTPVPSKRCDNCNLWVPAKGEEPKACGGCKIMKGPIHPAGYCTAWAPGAVKPS